MKKFLTMIAVLTVAFMTNCAMAQETTDMTKTEQIMNTISEKTEAATDKTVESVKYGSKKAGRFIKEKSVIVGEKTVEHAKSGAHKAKKATVKGANQVSNVTAKGMKKAAQKMQNSAERTIEKTNKNLEEMKTPKCKCEEIKCNCNNDCGCADNTEE